MELVIVSGLSGAGKSKTAGTLEDLGYYCVDNMPAELFVSFAAHCLAAPGRYSRVLLVSDVRGGQTFDGLFRALAGLDRMGCKYQILFVEASRETIIRRYKETRRRHPLQSGDITLVDAVDRERTLLAPVRSRANYVLDTSTLNNAQLRTALRRLLCKEDGSSMMSVTVLSFGYKYGIPTSADLVFDVRLLPNPYYIPELKQLSGLDTQVREYLNSYQQTKDVLVQFEGLLGYSLPLYEQEGKTNLVVAIGCTGGRHRSVAIAAEVGDFIAKRGYPTTVRHTDLNRDSALEDGV